MISPAERFADLDDVVDALCNQKIVQGNRDVARAIADAGEVVAFAPGEELIRQGATDTDCYFLLMGEVEIRVNGEMLPYRRIAGEAVGEFAAINAQMARTATIVAWSNVVALKCTSQALRLAGRQEPELWRLLAIELTKKVEQRNQLIAVSNERPRIFIIAVESRIEIAREIRLKLLAEAEVDLWSDEDLVPPGGYVLDTLHMAARAADFGIVLAHPEDLRDVRNRLGEERWETVRFELGYLMSELTRHRTLLLVPYGDAASPELFKGVQPMTYRLPSDDLPLDVAVTAAVDQIRQLIVERKVRSRLPSKG
ncbi:putative nucleotide-binding protein with TIR-like domain [Rhizobium sp. PP-F2F-G38]|nr:putative nucleotide-binding protein with TIR-like domain [Rhizobium sp. PP-F2F-G38]